MMNDEVERSHYWNIKNNAQKSVNRAQNKIDSSDFFPQDLMGGFSNQQKSQNRKRTNTGGNNFGSDGANLGSNFSYSKSIDEYNYDKSLKKNQ